ncbi:MAG: hypothetical protein ABR511_11185 [Acidimicrobiales bacterium]
MRKAQASAAQDLRSVGRHVVATAALLLAVAACSGGGRSSSPTTTQSSTTSTTRHVTVREWALPSLPYVQKMEADFAAVQTAAKSGLDAVRSNAATLADDARGFRLALASSGPPPPAAAIVGPAVVEATSGLEQASRALAACIGSDCLPKISTVNTAVGSWGSALQELTKHLND